MREYLKKDDYENENIEDLFEYDFTKLTLDDEEESNNKVEIDVEESKIINQPDSDFKQIDELLKKTQVRSYKLKDALDDIKNTAARLRTKGFEIKLEEMDFENTYQVVIKIEKDK